MLYSEHILNCIYLYFIYLFYIVFLFQITVGTASTVVVFLYTYWKNKDPRMVTVFVHFLLVQVYKSPIL